ncbi:hypothetical protein, partial [Akkermansia sp.]|uniref:hypothetical protein n=3 Tax=Akkermansia TaxID=239934 RepID=UPI003AADD57D
LSVFIAMKPIKFLLVPVALFLGLGNCIAAGDAELPGKWTTFGKGEERGRFARCFIISYPSSFTIDPASGISFSPDIGRDVRIPEGNLYTLVLHDEKKSLEVRASTYGFITEDFYVPRGFETPREVILADLFTHRPITKIIRTKHYDLFYSETDKRVCALYLYRKEGWNASYQTLTFLFRNGTTFEDHEEIVKKIMEGFIPYFARSD